MRKAKIHTMIQAADFIEPARAAGFIHYVGVPCSFLTPFINYVINDAGLHYIAAANEGDAVATAAGLAIAGRRSVAMMQNSGLGNAVNPLTSLTNVFNIPILIIATHRGAPGVADEPQHVLMGEITAGLFELMRIEWAPFPRRAADIGPALQGALQYMQAYSRPYAFIMQKGTVAPCALEQQAVPTRTQASTAWRHAHDNNDSDKAARPTRRQALTEILRHSPAEATILIATTGYTGRELFALADRPNQLYMVGSMGCASALGLGLAMGLRVDAAKARTGAEIKVIVIDGDAAVLMRMGNLATIGSYGPANLIHLLLDNGVHDSTGAQATVSTNVRFAEIAQACGYGLALSGRGALGKIFAARGVDGARFAHIRIKPGTIDNLPRPNISPADALARLRQAFGL